VEQREENHYAIKSERERVGGVELDVKFQIGEQVVGVEGGRAT
jgi:hypothetical protein